MNGIFRCNITTYFQNNHQVPSQSSQQLQAQPLKWPQSKPIQETMTSKQKIEYTPPPQNLSQPQYNQQPVGVRIEIRANSQPYEDVVSEGKKPNAVFVTQPRVFQHPGLRPAFNEQRQKTAVNNQGPRVIPVQTECSKPTSPSTSR